MLCNSDSFIQMCTFLLIFFSIMVYDRVLNIVPTLYSRTLLIIHHIYNSLHLLSSNKNTGVGCHFLLHCSFIWDCNCVLKC